LLHDIGHAPFSHVGEDQNVFPEKVNHEDIAINIIKETDIGKIINNNYGAQSIERIIFIITGKTAPVKKQDLLFHDLLSGQAGIDRMDYLLRDSYFLGVMYGRFDIERLIETICFDAEKSFLYWEEGGCHALEQFLLARYFMFTEVYFHKTRRSIDYHLGNMIKDYLREHYQIDQLPTVVDEYIRLDDNRVFSWAMTQEKYYNLFIKRNFFRRIKESSDHASPDELEFWEKIKEKMQASFSPEDYFIDSAGKDLYKYEKDEILVKCENEFLPMHKKSKLIEHLRPLNKRILYADKSSQQTILDILKTLN